MALLNVTNLKNGWLLEEHDSADRVKVCKASVPSDVVARFCSTLHRVPSIRTVRVFYYQGASVEDSRAALGRAMAASGRRWREATPLWTRKRARSGKYRFVTTIGRVVEVEAEFARLAKQLDLRCAGEVRG